MCMYLVVCKSTMISATHVKVASCDLSFACLHILLYRYSESARDKENNCCRDAFRHDVQCYWRVQCFRFGGANSGALDACNSETQHIQRPQNGESNACGNRP